MTQPQNKATGVAKYIITKSIQQDPKTKIIVMRYRFAWWKLGYWREVLKMSFTEQHNAIQTMEGQKIAKDQMAKRNPAGKQIDV
jgi:hypothetical protein